MKVGTLKLLSDIMSHLATNMPHIAPFEGSKGHGAPSDVLGVVDCAAWQWTGGNKGTCICQLHIALMHPDSLILHINS